MKICLTNLFLLTSGLVVTVGVVAQEQKIKRSDLPPAVEKRVIQESAGATIKGFTQEKENGKMFYEVEMTVNGHTKDVLIDDRGAVVEMEEEVAMGALPAEVKAGLLAKAGGGKLLKVESLAKRGVIVAYEAKVDKDGKKSEIQVGPDGKALSHEE